MPDPTTPNLGLTLPVIHEQGWGVGPTNSNWEIVDAFAGTVVFLTSATTQIINQSAGTTAFNALQAYSTGIPNVSFGNTPGSPTGHISEYAAGYYSFDGPTPGDQLGSATGQIFNALDGFQVNGTAPTNHILVGNGSFYVDSATLPPGVLFYQTMQQAGVSQPQEPTLNFLAPFTATDNPGIATNVGMQNSGVVAGSYTNANITVNSQGLITAASSGGMSGSSTATVYNVTGSRTFGVTYLNAYGAPIYVSGWGLEVSGGSVGQINGSIGASSPSLQVFGISPTSTEAGGYVPFAMIVPTNWYYELQVSGDVSGTPGRWIETVL